MQGLRVIALAVRELPDVKSLDDLDRMSRETLESEGL
jgi:hypothetical protein